MESGETTNAGRRFEELRSTATTPSSLCTPRLPGDPGPLRRLKYLASREIKQEPRPT